MPIIGPLTKHFQMVEKQLVCFVEEEMGVVQEMGVVHRWMWIVASRVCVRANRSVLNYPSLFCICTHVG